MWIWSALIGVVWTQYFLSRRLESHYGEGWKIAMFDHQIGMKLSWVHCFVEMLCSCGLIQQVIPVLVVKTEIAAVCPTLQHDYSHDLGMVNRGHQ